MKTCKCIKGITLLGYIFKKGEIYKYLSHDGDTYVCSNNLNYCFIEKFDEHFIDIQEHRNNLLKELLK